MTDVFFFLTDVFRLFFFNLMTTRVGEKARVGQFYIKKQKLEKVGVTPFHYYRLMFIHLAFSTVAFFSEAR